MKCPKCGAENFEESNYCVNCNNNLKEENSLLINDNPSIANNEIDSKKDNKSGNNIPKIIVILIAVIGILLILSAVGITVFQKMTTPKNELSYDLDSLILVKKNDKYGYINKNGKVIIEQKYDYATDFVNGFAMAKLNSDEKTPYHIIDKKGNTIVKSEYDAEYNSKYKYWIIDDKLYNDKMKLVTGQDVIVDYSKYNDGYLSWTNKKTKTGGILTPKGKVSYQYKFNNQDEHLMVKASEVDEKLKEHYCVVTVFKKDDDYEGIVNCDTGKVIYDYTKESIYADDYNIFKIGDNKHIYIQNDKIVYETSLKRVDFDYDSDGYIEVEDESKEYGEEGKYTYIDIKTGQVVNKKETKNEEEEDLDELEKLVDVKEFSCGSKYGLMNGKKIIIPCEWDGISNLNPYIYLYLNSKGKKYVLAEKDNKIHLLNVKNKKVIATFETDSIIQETNSSFIYFYNEKRTKITIYNLITNKSITIDRNEDYTYCDIYFNYATVKNKKKKTYYNIDLKEIYVEE